MRLPVFSIVGCSLALACTNALATPAPAPLQEGGKEKTPAQAVGGEASPAPVAAAQSSAAEGGERWTQAELETASKEIMADVEELRGEKFQRPVAVKVSSKEDLITYIKAREEKSTPPAQFAADELIGKMLGVLPPAMDLRAQMYAMLEAQVGGFYDPDTDSFSLMEWLPHALTEVVLSHELDHALDDQLFGMDKALEAIGKDTDAQFAYHAVIEGSGTAVMTRWLVEKGDPKKLASMSSSSGAGGAMDLMSMAGAPDWLWKPMMGSYTVGAAFLAKTTGWMTAGAKPLDAAAVRTAFEVPPRSTEQILHPDKYWDAAKRDDPRKVTFDTKGLDKDWSVLREDTLGELAIAIVTTPPAARDKTDFSNPMSILGVQFTNDVAAGWDGDRLVLLGNGDARILRWVSVWDSERDAGEFYGAMLQQAPGLEAAAKALSAGADSDDAGASVEYGAKPDEVVITVRAHASRGELKRVLRHVEHAHE